MLTPTTKCSSPWSRCMRICTKTRASQLDFALGKKARSFVSKRRRPCWRQQEVRKQILLYLPSSLVVQPFHSEWAQVALAHAPLNPAGQMQPELQNPCGKAGWIPGCLAHIALKKQKVHSPSFKMGVLDAPFLHRAAPMINTLQGYSKRGGDECEKWRETCLWLAHHRLPGKG